MEVQVQLHTGPKSRVWLNKQPKCGVPGVLWGGSATSLVRKQQLRAEPEGLGATAPGKSSTLQ